MVETPTEERIAVYLTPEEAVLYVQFQKRFAFIKLMESVGAFDIKRGSITVNFDNLGGIQSMDVTRVYRQ